MIYLIEIGKRATIITTGTENELYGKIVNAHNTDDDAALVPGSSFDEALEVNSHSLNGQIVYMSTGDAREAYDNDARWCWAGGEVARDLLGTALEKAAK